MTSPTRVLFLEVDAGDKVLIQRWAADGTLPTFRELLARGAVGDTLAPEYAAMTSEPRSGPLLPDHLVTQQRDGRSAHA